MIENKKVLEMIQGNKELQGKVSACQTAEELMALAKEYSIEVTKEQVDEVIASRKELSDDELENVAGGRVVDTKTDDKIVIEWEKDEHDEKVWNAIKSYYNTFRAWNINQSDVIALANEKGRPVYVAKTCINVYSRSDKITITPNGYK